MNQIVEYKDPEVEKKKIKDILWACFYLGLLLFFIVFILPHT